MIWYLYELLPVRIKSALTEKTFKATNTNITPTTEFGPTAVWPVTIVLLKWLMTDPLYLDVEWTADSVRTTRHTRVATHTKRSPTRSNSALVSSTNDQSSGI